jgi:uncharacterized cupredoxin-like copper-binding protein
MMLKAGVVAVLLAMFAVPALAHDGHVHNVAAPFTVDSTIEAIAADARAKAVLDAVFPGMTSHPMYEQFKGMTVKQLQPMASDQITDAGIAKLTTELAALK